MVCLTSKCALLLLLASRVVSSRVRDHSQVQHALATDLGTSAIDPCEVLKGKIYANSHRDKTLKVKKDWFRTGVLQSLEAGSPFLTIGALFWYEPYGTCQVTEIVNPRGPEVKARSMTGEIAQIAKREKGADDFVFENRLKNNEFQPLLPGSPIGTLFETAPEYRNNGTTFATLSEWENNGGVGMVAPGRSGVITSTAWQDKALEKMFVSVKYLSDGSTADVEVGSWAYIFKPGGVEAKTLQHVLPGVTDDTKAKTMEFTECTTNEWAFGIQGDTKVTVKTTNFNGILEILNEDMVEWRGKIKDRVDGRAGREVTLELEPVHKLSKSARKTLSLQFGDSLQTSKFMTSQTDFGLGKKDTHEFYAQSFH